MISLIRHNISLLVTLAVFLAGIGVLIYGAFQLVGSIGFSLSLATSPSVNGVRWHAVILILAQHAITALVGLATVYFAGAGFLRRWRAGPPDDEEGVGKSPITKTIALVIYAAGAVYGAYGLIFGMGPLLEEYQLAISGDRAGARIIGTEPAPDIHWDAHTVRYQFQTQDGQTIVGTRNMFTYPAEQLLKRGTTEVTYDPTNPALNRIEFSFSLQSAIYFFGGQLVFLLVGIWGFAKNAQALGDAQPRPPVLDKAYSAAPPVVDRNTARATFGRRGV